MEQVNIIDSQWFPSFVEGQYSVLNTDIDDEAPPPVPPYNPEIDNEYSVLKREDREV